MRISFYLPRVYLKPGGGAKVILEFANYLCKKQHDVNIYYYMYGNYGERETFIGSKGKIKYVFTMMEKIIGSTIGARLWFPLNTQINQYVIENSNSINQADVIVVTASQLVEPVLLGTYGCSYIYLIQGYETWQYSEEELKKIFNMNIHKIVVSRWLKNKVDKISKTTSILVSNGIDTSIFKAYGLRREPYSIVFQYRSAGIKGGEYALKVIDKLYKKYPHLKVYIISRERRHPRLPKCCKYLYNLTPKEVANVNNKCKVFICTTIEEGFGLPGLEAMACGCAVVSTSYDAVYEYAVDGVNSMLSPVRDVDSMVENIVTLFENDKLYNKITMAGIQTGRERSKDISLQQFEKIIIDINKESVS